MKMRITVAALFGVCMATLVAQQNQAPAFPRAADALERVTWRTRTLVANDRLTNWDFAIPGMGLTFLESVVRADAALVPFVEASSTQRVSPQVQKNLDHNLTAAEIAARQDRNGTERPCQRVPRREPPCRCRDATPGVRLRAGARCDDDCRPGQHGISHGLDTLAEEFSVNVAVLNSSAETVKAMEGRSRRLGVGIDTGQWAQDGTNVRDGVTRVKDRLLYVLLRDRSARGANAQNVPLGKGVANLREFFAELERQDDRQISTRLGGDGSPVVTTRVPIAMTLDTTGVVKAPGDLFTAVSAFEDVVQPAYAANFLEFSRTRPIRFDVVTPSRGETLVACRDRETRRRDAREDRRRDSEQADRGAEESPQAARRSRASKGCRTTPSRLTNVMIQRMGEKTGAGRRSSATISATFAIRRSRSTTRSS